MMNGYICFYRGRRTEVYAHTTVEAQAIASLVLKAKQLHEVDVHLIEKAGKQQTTTTAL